MIDREGIRQATRDKYPSYIAIEEEWEKAKTRRDTREKNEPLISYDFLNGICVGLCNAMTVMEREFRSKEQ